MYHSGVSSFTSPEFGGVGFCIYWVEWGLFGWFVLIGPIASKASMYVVHSARVDFGRAWKPPRPHLNYQPTYIPTNEPTYAPRSEVFIRQARGTEEKRRSATSKACPYRSDCVCMCVRVFVVGGSCHDDMI